jgi:orotate phosphoribosyltransferase
VTVDATLAADIDAACRLTGTFILRSGQVSNEYFDKYLFEAQPALLDRIAAAMVELLPGNTKLLGGLVKIRPVLTKADLDEARAAATA